MKSVNIHEAKTRLSRLIASTINGEPFVIAKASQFTVPDDFDQMGQDEIATMFGGDN
ncbi:MAG: hypothetical protein MO846_03320 [Candidatus Devosia symbiotica]|nr:hypothetical protein [Candidatus Devosia symbiotica]